MTKTVKTKRFR